MTRAARKRCVQVDPTPLFGFGLLGWTSLVLLISLVAIAFSDVNLVTQAQRIWMSLFGVNAMLRATTYAMFPYLLWNGPLFGILGFCAVLAAMCVHPRRTRWWWVAIFAGWAFARALLIPGSMKGHWLPMPLQGMGLPPEAELYLVTVALLALWTRSLTVALGALAISIASLAILRLWPAMPRGVFIAAGIVYNATLLALLLWWSIRARMRWKPIGHCYACGYDVRGLAGGICPECGHSVTPDGRPRSIIARTTRAASLRLRWMLGVGGAIQSEGGRRSPRAAIYTR